MNPPAARKPAGTERRPYHSPLRRQQAAETRERILRAATELVRGFRSWDWRDLTFRAVAERAGVGERTVYRYFGTERELREAVMDRLQEEAGTSYDGLTLEGIAEVAAKVFTALSTFTMTSWAVGDEASLTEPFPAVDERRRTALIEAVAPETGRWTPEDRLKAAAVLDVLWNVPSYERLLRTWQLPPDQAIDALAWAIGVLVAAIRQTDAQAAPSRAAGAAVRRPRPDPGRRV